MTHLQKPGWIPFRIWDSDPGTYPCKNQCGGTRRPPLVTTFSLLCKTKKMVADRLQIEVKYKQFNNFVIN